MTPARVDSLRSLVDFNAFELTPDSLHLIKRIAGARLDFSAIAKGYGVDEVGRYLASRGIDAFFVEIGGEVVTKGPHPEGRPWRVGIDRPLEESTERTLQAIVLLENQGMATSGNYRNFYVVDGQKFAHTIDPATGYPVRSTLLSATVVAVDCMTADGFATAAMVMGAEKAMDLFASRGDIEAFFVVSGPDSSLVETMTPEFSRLLAPDAP